MDNILLKIHKAALKFLSPLTPEETYPLIVNEGKILLKTQYGSIFLMQSGVLKRVWASTPTHHEIRIRKDGNTYRTFKNHKANVMDIKVLEKHHPQFEKFKKLGVKSIVSIPLINHGKSIGVLSLQSTKKEYFTKSQLNTLILFGSLASLAIRKNQLFFETKQALEARDLFISMAAHELRTPVTTISGYSQMLYSKFAGSDTPESRWITDLSWETQRLTHLINELLEIDRIKKGVLEYHFKEISIREVLRRAASDFKMNHPNHNIILDDNLKNGEDIIIGDFNKLLQMLINIFDNAAKFSRSGTDINIVLKSNKSHLKIIIKDKGKGISKKEIADIFDKYYRGKSEIKEGMGIGLFLVKNIIKQHHGDIQIFSKENIGTKVEIGLPTSK
ncbi:hypothetical protein A3C59_05065 [Candidatus Daviesbacteria bacterium RIFCSPHIGHO2_02_FULL_36_13]|uniref:histidine kinase n=1 Tax=Candidatus Daviesbacteria bacterium RIFCSPHIGHO2_02_FULL_36_13 TaxID=1797768 RepID=A0A1F5JXY3_9BACT|nr:MAG: hypothetical protein A3C59_05065 [Candidatus Daviesbacteria bacterium RIFCSPHIGHO2_02_FULL_36_13]OGE41607.1 MAG: hypothetical protein A3A45_00740 [Candidatus Daviesbacteria bacterium RIFCSPLOWO2_01_FULL_36_8]